MKEHPILFSGPMVRAILEGRKTQTRRVIKPQPIFKFGGDGTFYWKDEPDRFPQLFECPYGQPGDHLWVREAFAPNYFDNGQPGYKADWSSLAAEYVKEPRWYPSIHMPRYLSRITLEITGIRVGRLQDISEKDCCLETGSPLEWEGPGDEPYKRDMRTAFATLWDSINAGRGYSFDSNPWVWVVEFRRVEQ